MDFASLLVTGAAPTADPSALLGAPSAVPATGNAFADVFAQAMVALPTGVETASAVPALGDPATGFPAPTGVTPLLDASGLPGASGLPSAPVLPSVSGPSSFGTPSVAPTLDPSAPTDEVASAEPPVASAPNPGTRPHGDERIGKKVGVPTLPSCPTATFLPDCPTSPTLLPNCPLAPSESPTPIKGGAPMEGGESGDTFALDDEDSLDEGSFPLPTTPTATTPVPAPNASTLNVGPTAPIVVPGTAAKSLAKVAAVGSATKPSEALTAPDDAAPEPALPVALDLGIVPHVTVTALDSETPAAAPPVLDTPTASQAQLAPVPTSGQPVLPPPPPVAPPTPAPKDEVGASASIRTESVKGREAAFVPSAPKTTAEPAATKAGTKANLAEPVLEIAVQERKDDGEAPSGGSPKDASPESVMPQPAESGVRETAATARPEAGTDRPAVDRHLVVKQVADRIENMVAARPRDGVTIHMEPHELGTVTLVVKGLASALDVQVTASDERVRQSLDASRPELAQALAPRGIGLREIRVEYAPSTTNSPSSTAGDSGSGTSQGRSGSGSSQSQPKQNPSAFRSAAPSAPRPRASRANGRGVDLLV